MAVLDDADRRAAMAALMRSHNIGAVTKPALRSAADATDDFIDGIASSYNAALPEPFRSAANLQEKTLLLNGPAFCLTGESRKCP